MPISIGGVKYKVSELDGTDIDMLRIFCNKNKCNGAVIFYVDDEGKLDNCGFYRTKSGKSVIDGLYSLIDRFL